MTVVIDRDKKKGACLPVYLDSKQGTVACLMEGAKRTSSLVSVGTDQPHQSTLICLLPALKKTRD